MLARQAKFGVMHGADQFTTAESERLVRLPLFYNMDELTQRTVIQTMLNFFA